MSEGEGEGEEESEGEEERIARMAADGDGEDEDEAGAGGAGAHRAADPSEGGQQGEEPNGSIASFLSIRIVDASAYTAKPVRDMDR